MLNKKILILVPDGIGFRNFAYTNFYKIGLSRGYNVKFWNSTSFKLKELGFQEINIQNASNHPFTDILKNAQTQIELTQNIKKSKDNVYDSYRFPFKFYNHKDLIKIALIKLMILFNNSKKGLNRIRYKIEIQERKTKLYNDSLETLKTEKPAFVFCTNQRITVAVAPILAAKDLGIPTATFIFSWDNLPKGTKILETDFYFVWSQHMKTEILYYYPHLTEKQVFVTGTPQFESHFNSSIILSKEDFFKQNNLDYNKKYICFSGDDITTSPNDPKYLEDIANAIKFLNLNKDFNLGILFRRCPVDFSDRYDYVLKKFEDIIISVVPKWEKKGEAWNEILPTQSDLILQMNTIFHTESVINLGSSMVFDYAAFNKPCGYINYDVKNENIKKWSVEKIYNYIHFRSMPDKNSVYWINSANEISFIIEEMLSINSNKIVENANKWFEKINQQPPEKASERIWDSISKIIEN